MKQTDFYKWRRKLFHWEWPPAFTHIANVLCVGKWPFIMKVIGLVCAVDFNGLSHVISLRLWAFRTLNEMFWQIVEMLTNSYYAYKYSRNVSILTVLNTDHPRFFVEQCPAVSILLCQARVIITSYGMRISIRIRGPWVLEYVHCSSRTNTIWFIAHCPLQLMPSTLSGKQEHCEPISGDTTPVL
jgi:hypothetical protein